MQENVIVYGDKDIFTLKPQFYCCVIVDFRGKTNFEMRKEYTKILKYALFSFLQYCV